MRIATDRQLLLIVLIVALIAVMTILEPTTFPRPANAAVVLLDTAQTGILACGMMLLMISGMFDLSIGGILAFSGIMAGLAAKNLGLPPIAGVPGRLRLGRPARRRQRRARHALQDQRADRDAGHAFDLPRRPAARVRRRRHQHRQRLSRSSARRKILGIYSPFWFMAVIVLLFAFLVGPHPLLPAGLLHRRQCRARRSCRASTSTAPCSVFFVIMGLLAGLAGALLASRLNTAVVLAGQGVELKVITAVVLGGASLSGGVGTIFGAFLGVLFMALLQNAMIIAGINPFWQLIVVGIVLLISVGLDQFARDARAES